MASDGDARAGALYTIGYEGTSIEPFVAALAAHRIDRVVDVRERPWSRKKGFSRDALAARLAAAGIEYSHLASLGSPSALRRQVREDHDYEAFFAAFERYVVTQGEALEQVERLAGDEAVVLLCFERDPCECHRSVVAQLVSEAAGLVAQHIHVGGDRGEPVGT